MKHSDGGKGSGRRKEDASKVRDNWDLIWGNKKDKEKSKMDTWNQFDDDDNEHIEDEVEDGEYDDTCTWCGGCGEGDYDGASCRHCHGTGIEPNDGVDDDYT